MQGEASTRLGFTDYGPVGDPVLANHIGSTACFTIDRPRDVA